MAPSRGVYDAIRDEYRDMSTWYDTFWASYTVSVIRRPVEEVVRIVRRRAAARARESTAVLDVGAGTGALLRRLRDETLDLGDLVGLAGAEPSREMLEQARRKFDADEGVDLEQSCAGMCRYVQACISWPVCPVRCPLHRCPRSHLFLLPILPMHSQRTYLSLTNRWTSSCRRARSTSFETRPPHCER